MNYKAPIRNNKLLEEAYEAGRASVLNEQAGMMQPPSMMIGGRSLNQGLYRSQGGGGAGHGAPRPPHYPDHLPWPVVITPGNGPSGDAGPGIKPVLARDPVTGMPAGYWYCAEVPPGSGNWIWTFDSNKPGEMPSSGI